MPWVGDQDQVLRGLEDAAALFDFLVERLPGFLGFGDVAGDLGDADDRARWRPDRGDAERNLDWSAIVAQPHRFVVLDRFAPADPAQDVPHLGQPLGRDDQIDILPDRFRRGKSEQPFGRRIPAGDVAVERFRDDGVVGGFDRGAEQTLALGKTIAGCFGAAMFLNLVFERDGFCIGFAHRPREGARQHAGLAGCIDRNGGRAVAAGAFDRGVNCTIGRVNDRATSTANTAAHNTAIRPTRAEVFLDRCGRRHDDGVRGGLDHRDPFIAGQNGRRERDSARPSVLIRHDMPDALRGCRATTPDEGKSLCQLVGLPSSEPNSRARSG